MPYSAPKPVVLSGTKAAKAAWDAGPAPAGSIRNVLRSSTNGAVVAARTVLNERGLLDAPTNKNNNQLKRAANNNGNDEDEDENVVSRRRRLISNSTVVRSPPPSHSPPATSPRPSSASAASVPAASVLAAPAPAPAAPTPAAPIPAAAPTAPATSVTASATSAIASATASTANPSSSSEPNVPLVIDLIDSDTGEPESASTSKGKGKGKKPAAPKKPVGRPKKKPVAPAAATNTPLDSSSAVIAIQLANLASANWERNYRLAADILDRRLNWIETHPDADQTLNPWLTENMATHSIHVPDPLRVMQFDFTTARQIISRASGLPDLSLSESDSTNSPTDLFL